MLVGSCTLGIGMDLFLLNCPLLLNMICGQLKVLSGRIILYQSCLDRRLRTSTHHLNVLTNSKVSRRVFTKISQTILCSTVGMAPTPIPYPLLRFRTTQATHSGSIRFYHSL